MSHTASYRLIFLNPLFLKFYKNCVRKFACFVGKSLGCRTLHVTLTSVQVSRNRFWCRLALFLFGISGASAAVTSPVVKITQVEFLNLNLLFSAVGTAILRNSFVRCCLAIPPKSVFTCPAVFHFISLYLIPTWFNR